MAKCPQCGEVVASLDRPCPACEEGRVRPIPPEFSKTFRIRTAFRYHPENLVKSLNDWLWEQTDLIGVGALIQRDRQGLVGEVTLTCRHGWEPSPVRFQFARVVVAASFVGRPKRTLGDALNDWTEENPGRQRVTYWSVSVNGRPVEAWVLYVERMTTSADSALRALES